MADDLLSGAFGAVSGGVTAGAVIGYLTARLNAARAEQGRHYAEQRRRVYGLVLRFRTEVMDKTNQARQQRAYPADYLDYRWREQFGEQMLVAADGLPRADGKRIGESVATLIGAVDARLCREFAYLPAELRTDEYRLSWFQSQPDRYAPVYAASLESHGLIGDLLKNINRDPAGTKKRYELILATFDEMAKVVRPPRWR